MSEFRPLVLDKVPSARAEPAEPRSWYEVIAERFPVEEAPSEPIVQPAANGVHRALFESVEAIAHTAAQRRRAGAPVPPELQRIREDAAAEARQIIADARLQARAILEESREQGRRDGYQAGFTSGDRDARDVVTRQAEADRAAAAADLTAFISAMEETSRQAWIDMEPEILALVFEIASKVIKMEVEMNRSAAIEAVKHTLRRVADSTSVRIRVHSDDLSTVRANRDELLSVIDDIRKVEIIEDRRVGAGGCIIETNAGTIDARIDTQLEEIRKLLRIPAPGERQ